jgi:DNA polymerase type B, organellar and viral
MPLMTEVWPAPLEIETIIRERVMRGGFCFSARKYRGPVWKYDINQAYAAAMRDAWLPAGRCIETPKYHPYALCAIYRVTARKRGDKTPFYVRDSEGKGTVALGDMRDVWITSSEYAQLKAEKWAIEVHQGYFWDNAFRMVEYVGRLEHLRVNAPAGPKSAQGEMMKALGNNSYGKTVEELGGYELVMAAERPEGYFNYLDIDNPVQHLWFKFSEPQMREYHQPQIGAFITAHVRMVVRRAILEAPQEWLYADTDCVMYSKPVELPIDPLKYGYWKVEAEGEEFILITKKVYAVADGSEKKAKGLNTRSLTISDFVKWYDGEAPMQTQVQRNNFVSVMSGNDMFVNRTKTGQR